MSKNNILAVVIVLVLIVTGLVFYNVVTQREDGDFKEGLTYPKAIVIGNKEIADEVAAKTLVMEIQKSPLEKATKSDMRSINENDKAFSISAKYDANTPKNSQITKLEVLNDGSFIASKSVNGRMQYVKGQFNKYTMDFLTALYTLE